MTLIPFPNVPNYPGVPSIPRTSPGAPEISVSLATPQNQAAQTAAYAENWGIFESDTSEALYTPYDGGTLSFFSLAFAQQMQISDFPIEANSTGQGAAFASFNKVFKPANPIVTFALGGSVAEQSGFLGALAVAVASTTLYDVITPEASYFAYSIESYSYQRTAQRGASMLMVEISLKQILQVSPSVGITGGSLFPINSPQSPSAAPPINNGLTQPSAPSQSTLSKLLNGSIN
jgi:hypothetical protein